MKENKKIKINVPNGYDIEDLCDTDYEGHNLGQPIIEEEVGIEFGKE